MKTYLEFTLQNLKKITYLSLILDILRFTQVLFARVTFTFTVVAFYFTLPSICTHAASDKRSWHLNKTEHWLYPEAALCM